MTKQLRVRSIRRRDVDDEQLAVAFLLLAKILHEREHATRQHDELDDQQTNAEAA